ncbi:MAG: thioesterase family protein [Bacteroidales bacterium]|nr:thioesterase family protein [Bacteroidales bacterium]
MKDTLKLGLSFETTLKSEPKHSAMTYGSGLVDVFSTPAMVAFMEQTSNELLNEHIDSSETSVGIEICVKHLKATPIGDIITCKAQIIEIYKNKITFSVEAYDSRGKIGEGTHKRAVVNKEQFLKSII